MTKDLKTHLMPLEWYALKSKPNKETLLLDQLLIRKVDAWYPRLTLKPVNPRSRRQRAYFPGYLFINVDLDTVPVSSLAWIPGASRLVSFDGQPASIPATLIDAIRAKVDRINDAGSELMESLRPGDRLHIHSGPFAGYQGIFDMRLSGTDRVRILLNLLQNRALRLEVPLAQLRLLDQRSR